MNRALAVLAAAIAFAACQHTAADVILGTKAVCGYEAVRHSDCPEEPGDYACECDGTVRPPQTGAESASGECRIIKTVCDGTITRGGIPVWPDGGAR